MGTLENVRDLLTGLVECGEDLALLDEPLQEWHDAGCPGYEPEPWGEPGVVPESNGIYAVWSERGGIRVVLLTEQSRPVWLSGGREEFRFRYLCPLPTSPEDV